MIVLYMSTLSEVSAGTLLCDEVLPKLVIRLLSKA